MKFSAQVEAWRADVAGPARAASMSVDLVLAWMQHESNGSVCSIGIAGVEAGPFQTYHPDDDRFGETFASLRENCAGSRLHTPLSADQRARYVRQGIRYIDDRRARARTALAAVDADWPEGSSDFWKLVKLHHALPALYGFLAAYKHAFGIAPSGWSQFRGYVEGLSESEFDRLVPAASRWSSSEQRARLFDNAEKVGKYGGVEALFGFVTVELAALLGIALVLYLMA